MRFRQLPSRLLPALALAACGGAEGPPIDDFGYAGTGIGVTIAPLELPGITDACYSFQIQNGQGQTVVARGGAVAAGDAAVAGQGGDGGPTGLSGAAANPLCSTRFGNSRGALSYVAPCDASTTPDGNENHSVTLWVNSVCQDGSGATLFDPDTGNGCVPLNGFVNPCGPLGCAVTAQCVENADTPVSFNFTVMASAQQGFFDVAVNFDSVFCSAKLDTCYEDGTPITLLHDALGTRQRTGVAAVACTAGPGDTATTLHFTDLAIDCGDGAQLLNLSEITQEGIASIGNLRGAVYFGTEALPDGGGPAGSANKVFTNVAFIIPEGASCSLDWLVVPAGSTAAPTASSGANGTFTQVAAVSFAAAELSRGPCANHPLNGSGSQVTTLYLDDSETFTSSLSIQMTNFNGTTQQEVPGCSGDPWIHDGTLTISPSSPPPEDYACITSITNGNLRLVNHTSDIALNFASLVSIPNGRIELSFNSGFVDLEAPLLTTLGETAPAGSFICLGSTNGGRAVLGLESMRAITFNSCNDFELTLPALTAVTEDVTLAHGSGIFASLGSLATIGGTLNLAFASALSFAAPSLQSVGVLGQMLELVDSDITLNLSVITGSPKEVHIRDGDNISLSFPNLTGPLDAVLFGWNDGNVSLALPLLESVADLQLLVNPGLTATALDLSSLSQVTDQILILQNHALSQCAVDELIDGLLTAPLPDNVVAVDNLDDTASCP